MKSITISISEEEFEVIRNFTNGRFINLSQFSRVAILKEISMCLDMELRLQKRKNEEFCDNNWKSK